MLTQRLTRPLRGRNNETTKHKKVRASWRNGEKEQRMKGGEIKEPDLKKKKKRRRRRRVQWGREEGPVYPESRRKWMVGKGSRIGSKGS